MKVTYNWLKEIVDLPVDPESLAGALTNAGIQLESMSRFGDDTVLDFEVTVNRPDCLSVFGLAREISVIFDVASATLPRNETEIHRIDGPKGSMQGDGLPLTIILEDPELCPRYCGQMIAGVEIGPSPGWLRAKLEACGLRSVNNVVDVTNYVMLELGQPLHAFDYAKLQEATIWVRRAQDEKLLMIDERERLLQDPMLVIADAQQAVAVAGVMGGKESEVSDQTTTLLLESAYFDPISIRKTAKKLELATDASYRFERGVDYNLQAIACRRASTLIQQLAGGRLYPVLDVNAKHFPPRQIRLRIDRIPKILGEKIDPDFIKRTLTGLGFSERSTAHENWLWEVPSFRVDVDREIDLIEEIARHYGYNTFRPTLPPAEKKYQDDYPGFELEKSVAALLRAARIDEAYTYAFTNPASPYMDATKKIRLLNPISEAMSEMRTSLIPNLLDSIDFNLRHRNEEARLFEIGRVFLQAGEEVHLGIALLDSSFQELKGIVEGSLTSLRYPNPLFREGIILLGGEPIGALEPAMVETRKVQTCELNLSKLAQIPRIDLRYQEIIPYPFVERDVSLVVYEKIRYAQMEETIKSLQLPHLKSFKLIDVFQGKNLPPGKVSFTFKLVFQAENRTLTSEEVDASYARLIEEFARVHNAELRK